MELQNSSAKSASFVLPVNRSSCIPPHPSVVASSANNGRHAGSATCSNSIPSRPSVVA